MVHLKYDVENPKCVAICVQDDVSVYVVHREMMASLEVFLMPIK